MQQAINHRFILARRRAQRLNHPVYESPAYVRRNLTPSVQIGILRDPAAPIEIFPAIHCPQVSRPDRYDLVAVLAVACLALIFFGVI